MIVILTFLPAGGGLLRQGLVLVEVQVLGTTVVTLLLQDLLVLVLSVELPAHNNSFWSRAEKRLFSAKWGVSNPIDSGEMPAPAIAKANVIHINTGILCQAILRKLQQNVLSVHGINLRNDWTGN